MDEHELGWTYEARWPAKTCGPTSGGGTTPSTETGLSGFPACQAVAVPLGLERSGRKCSSPPPSLPDVETLSPSAPAGFAGERGPEWMVWVPETDRLRRNLPSTCTAASGSTLSGTREPQATFLLGYRRCARVSETFYRL